MMRACLCFVGMVLLGLGVYMPSQAQMPPLEAYGSLPKVKSIAISDNGARVAMLRVDETGEYVLVRDLSTGESTGFRVENIKPLSVDFLGDGFVKLNASSTENLFNARGRFEYGFAFIFDVEKEKTYQLLEKEESIVPGTDATGVIGLLEETGEALIGATRYPAKNTALNLSTAGIGYFSYDVFRVDLSTGRTRLFEGNRASARLGSGGRAKYENAIDWLVDADGTILAREDYDGYKNSYKIFTRRSGGWKKVFENDPNDERFIGDRPYKVLGATPSRSALLVSTLSEDSSTRGVFELSLSGALSEPVFMKPGADIGRVLMDDQRTVFGVQYTGLYPSYEFYDEALQTAFDGLLDSMPEFSVRIIDWTKEKTKFVVEVSGSAETGNYYLFDVSTGRLSLLAKPWSIPAEWIGQTQTIEYKAKDGLTIPAVVTWPAGEASEDLPMIVLPHGGPALHDAIGFDWMAQFFASRGYLVFQPNFRGSDGFGNAFEMAGYGEWGGKMQSDITTGVKALASLGWVDPERVCIVGASYGGYAALAGGAFTPDLYACVAAIAPISDLADMLDEAWANSADGKKSYRYEYWSTLIGDPETDGERLRQISPALHADQFSAPVLLVHGRDDTVVRITQSRKMNAALQRAGLPVSLIEIAGGDHWLSTEGARLATLQAVAAFVETHNPAVVAE